MEVESFVRLGLTSGESKVYLALIKKGPLSKVKLASESRVSSSKVYEICKKLSDKELVSSFVKKNVQYFSALNPESLLNYVADKEAKVLKEKEMARELVLKLKKIYSSKKDSHVEVFEGWQGADFALSKAVSESSKGSTIYGFGIELEREGLLHKYHRQRVKKGIKQKLIFPDKPSYRSKYKGNNIKFIQGITEVGIGIFDDKIVLQDLGENPFGVAIFNKNIRNSFKKIYDFLWRNSSSK